MYEFIITVGCRR
jgi:hypothetical protein